MDDLIKASISDYLRDIANASETDLDNIYSLVIEMMMEEGYLTSDIERVVH